MSSPTASSPACTELNSTFTLTHEASIAPTSLIISPATLSTELSESTMLRLGLIDQESEMKAHSSFPPDFTGRLVLVFWQDVPILYTATRTLLGSEFTPAQPGAKVDATLPPVLIDPRLLSGPISRIDFASGVISPDGSPEATDGSQKTSHKSKSDNIQHSGAGGSGSGKGSGKGQKSGGEGGSGKGKGKQSADDDTRDYNRNISTAVDYLTELPQMVISAEEFLTFFPHHTKWPTVLFRLYRHGWSTGSIAKLQLHARGNLDNAEYQRRQATLRHQLRTATINKYGHGSIPSEMRQQGHAHFQPFSQHSSGNNVDLYDVRNPMEPSGDMYEPPRGQNTLTEPARLQDVINGVVNWPTGQDAGQLTQALRYAQANGLLQQTTRDLPGIVLQQGFAVQTDANTTQYDLRAVERLNNAVAAP